MSILTSRCRSPPAAQGSEASPAVRNTLDSARIPRASKLLICGLFQMGRVLAQDEDRRKVLSAFFDAHPERFVKGRPKPPDLPVAAWINPPPNNETLEIGSGATLESSDDLEPPGCVTYRDPSGPHLDSSATDARLARCRTEQQIRLEPDPALDSDGALMRPETRAGAH